MDSTVTLLIPTRNRPSSVDLLLSSLKVHGYLQRQGFSVLVADDSSDNATADICQKYQVNHLSGLHQGKSAAMNLAIEHITSEFVAFFDDDIVVLDDQWLDKILRNFISDDIAYVSGKVVAYELTTPAQIKWEKKGALNKGDHRLELGSEFFHKPRLIGVPLTLF